MEIIPSSSFFFLLFILLLFSLHLSSSVYTLPAQYFINCGSHITVSNSHRNFTGDFVSASVSFKGQSSSVQQSEKSAETPSLYQTARVFREISSYTFEISNSGTFFVRLHFFPFSSSLSDLSTANFDVSASGSSLLSNFTVKNSTNLPMIEEFFLSINTSKFIFEFLPKNSSFAFINAIEVFIAPGNFIPDNASYVSTGGIRNDYKGSPSQDILQTVHRINVGGPTLAPDYDTLWRNWVPDDIYLYKPETAKNSSFHGDKPNYSEGESEYIAPDLVYQTAKEMNRSNDRITINFNITWSFKVTKNTKHFVRFHFCDIISPSLGVLFFNLYIQSKFRNKINPYQLADQLAAPFYTDFVVESDVSGLLNIISIGIAENSELKNAFLNGLEIMEILGTSGSVLSTQEHKSKKFVVVGSVSGGLALICILSVVLCLYLRWRKPKAVEIWDWSPVPMPRGGGGSSHKRTSEGSSHGADFKLRLKLSFDELLFATNNFDKKMIVGKGGFGHVFRGTLRNGLKVAVKRSDPGSGQGLPEFQTEIMVLSKIRHRHLVSLIGYCDEMSEMILVYEFMEKGTLKDHLCNSNFPPLTWRQRLEICIGAAKGLHYLHRGSTGVYIHRDVKSTNILLDDELVAKVADFGLSRLGTPDQTHVTTGVKGTFGYLDPDYFRTQQLTEKSDVYSFGVILLEVLCARPAIDILLPRDQVNLAEWGMICKRRGKLEEIVDPSIKDQINPNSLRKFAEIAEKCLHECGTDRPAMGDVLWDLEYSLQLQQTSVGREPHEDSMTDASAMLAPPNVQSFQSFSMSVEKEKDDMPILRDDSANMMATEVFSQLRIDDAR